MTKLYEKYPVLGDKENSQFFNEYMPKILDRRQASGIDDLLVGMRGIVVQVDTGDALKYMMELYLMTPYRFVTGYTCATHRAYILQVKPDYPAYIILEPTNKEYYDDFSAVDSLYPRAKEKHNVRYIGEIYHSKNALETAKILTTHEIRFQDPNEIKNAFLKNKNFYSTTISYFTNNCVIYTNNPMTDFDSLELGEKFDLSADEKDQLNKVHDVHVHFGLDKLVFGIDHMATRVLSNEREHAILEFLCMSNYYFWGAYNIEDSNSSTNICRNPNIDYELKSPAKVFTANNTPFYVSSINGLPSPTEDFVRNLGKRMHHIAYEVADGAREDGTKNIDYVVEKLISEKIPFLAQVIGECRDFPDLKQIFSKSSPHSFLITEYVQRCQGFAGFFTKTNVGYLTKAAGEDEKLAKKTTF